MRIWYLLLTFALTSCASSIDREDGVLYKEYQEFRALASLNSEKAVRPKISRDYMEIINEIDRKMPPELGFHPPLWKSLASEIRTEYSHYERIEGDKGCLTVNGLDKQEKPSSLSLYYINENGNWVFNYFESSFHDSIREYYTEPTCPD